MTDAWVIGDSYEPYVGRWSRLVAARFLEWLAVPPGRRWLDVGCGTGALTTAVLDGCAPSVVLGVDPSKGYADWAAAHVKDRRARFEVTDATHLPLDIADVVVSGLMLNFVPDPTAALDAMRAAAPTGVVAAYVWDYAGKMELIRHFWDAAVELNPAAAGLDEGLRFPICHPHRLTSLWHDADLEDVTVCAIEVPTSSKTSTTTGRRSSAARAQRLAMPCRSTRVAGTSFASESEHGCRSRLTGRSI